jgi:stage V sporulation protein B
MFEIFIGKGIEFACIALVTADVISEISAFLISYAMYYFDKKRYSAMHISKLTDKEIKNKLLGIALPVAFSTYFRSSLLTVEHILIPKCLTQSGLDRSTALSSYGTLHSMAMPILLFPLAILSSFSGLLIPELAEAKIKNKKVAVGYITRRAFQFSFIFSFLISGILICFSEDFGMLIYHSEEASRYIRLLAPLIPIMYLDGVTDAMLKGLGEQVYSMNVNIIDALISVFLVMILLPKYGMSGYIITIYIRKPITTFNMYSISDTSSIYSNGNISNRTILPTSIIF